MSTFATFLTSIIFIFLMCLIGRFLTPYMGLLAGIIFLLILSFGLCAIGLIVPKGVENWLDKKQLEKSLDRIKYSTSTCITMPSETKANTYQDQGNKVAIQISELDEKPSEADLKRFHVGAFLLPTIFFFFCGRYIAGLLSLLATVLCVTIPIPMIYAGINGSKIANECLNFRNIKEFNNHHFRWATWGIVLSILGFFIGFFIHIGHQYEDQYESKHQSTPGIDTTPSIPWNTQTAITSDFAAEVEKGREEAEKAHLSGLYSHGLDVETRGINSREISLLTYEVNKSEKDGIWITFFLYREAELRQSGLSHKIDAMVSFQIDQLKKWIEAVKKAQSWMQIADNNHLVIPGKEIYGAQGQGGYMMLVFHSDGSTSEVSLDLNCPDANDLLIEQANYHKAYISEDKIALLSNFLDHISGSVNDLELEEKAEQEKQQKIDSLLNAPQAAPASNDSTAAIVQPNTPSDSPSQPEDTVESSLCDFINDFLSRSRSGSPNSEIDLYADKVDYFGDGIKDQSYIAGDIDKYNLKWPQRTMGINGTPTLKHLYGDTYYIAFSLDYAVSNGSLSRQGTVLNEMNVTKMDGAWKITLIRQTKK